MRDPHSPVPHPRSGSPMRSAQNPNRLIIAVTGGSGLEPSPHAATAAARAGAVPVVDLGAGDAWSLRVLAQVAARVTGGFGVRVGAGCAATPADLRPYAVDLVVLTADAPWPAADLTEKYEVIVEVTSLAEARAAETAGVH